MTPPPASPLRLRLDSDALISNWRWLARQSAGAACGAAVKADGYGLGARAVVDRLAKAGCRDFFVATWGEALALGRLDEGLSLSVLHGVRDEDLHVARSGIARPVLSTPSQIARWRQAMGGACDVMIDTGMNRLGLDWRCEVAVLVEELPIHTLMSHLACADETHPLNDAQHERFSHHVAAIPAQRYSLANSAGICLGARYAFDLTRPGLALYGGLPREEARGHIRSVVHPQAQVVQRRRITAGDSVGYNGTFTAKRNLDAAILNIGYADGYLRGFSGKGAALADGVRLPVLGRVSMDLSIVDARAVPGLGEGDWVDIDYELSSAAALSGLSQYELLTGLGKRFDRVWA